MLLQGLALLHLTTGNLTQDCTQTSYSVRIAQVIICFSANGARNHTMQCKPSTVCAFKMFLAKRMIAAMSMDRGMDRNSATKVCVWPQSTHFFLPSCIHRATIFTIVLTVAPARTSSDVLG